MSLSVRAQYLRVKGQFPHALLFFRLGDVYELLGEDAQVAARELTLRLTTRAFAKDERVPMCGVPYHTAESHIKRLVARGYKVVICEQIGDPRTATGVVERDVVRVVTPASALTHHPAPGHERIAREPISEPTGMIVLPQLGQEPATMSEAGATNTISISPPEDAIRKTCAPRRGKKTRARTAVPVVQLAFSDPRKEQPAVGYRVDVDT